MFDYNYDNIIYNNNNNDNDNNNNNEVHGNEHQSLLNSVGKNNKFYYNDDNKQQQQQQQQYYCKKRRINIVLVKVCSYIVSCFYCLLCFPCFTLVFLNYLYSNWKIKNEKRKERKRFTTQSSSSSSSSSSLVKVQSLSSSSSSSSMSALPALSQIFLNYKSYFSSKDHMMQCIPILDLLKYAAKLTPNFTLIEKNNYHDPHNYNHDHEISTYQRYSLINEISNFQIYLNKLLNYNQMNDFIQEWEITFKDIVFENPIEVLMVINKKIIKNRSLLHVLKLNSLIHHSSHNSNHNNNHNHNNNNNNEKKIKKKEIPHILFVTNPNIYSSHHHQTQINNIWNLILSNNFLNTNYELFGICVREEEIEAQYHHHHRNHQQKSSTHLKQSYFQSYLKLPQNNYYDCDDDNDNDNDDDNNGCVKMNMKEKWCCRDRFDLKKEFYSSPSWYTTTIPSIFMFIKLPFPRISNHHHHHHHHIDENNHNQYHNQNDNKTKAYFDGADIEDCLITNNREKNDHHHNNNNNNNAVDTVSSSDSSNPITNFRTNDENNGLIDGDDEKYKNRHYISNNNNNNEKPANHKILRLTNEGSSCFINSVTQLMFCAHYHSNFKLFQVNELSSTLSRNLETLLDFDYDFNQIDVHIDLSTSSSSSVSSALLICWRKYLQSIYSTFPMFKKNIESDSAKFFEVIINYLLNKNELMNDDLLVCKNLLIYTSGCYICRKIAKENEKVGLLIYAGLNEITDHHHINDEKNNNNDNDNIFSKQFEDQSIFKLDEKCEHGEFLQIAYLYEKLPTYLFITLNSNPQFLIQNSPFYLNSFVYSSSSYPSHPLQNGDNLKFESPFNNNNNNLPPLYPQMEMYREYYNLIGMSVHIGESSRAGHYISYIKMPSNQWFLCDDERISEVNEKDLNNFSSNCVQLAVYKKIKKSSSPSFS